MANRKKLVQNDSTKNIKKKKKLKQLLKYVKAEYGQDDGSVRLEKDEDFLLDSIKENSLEKEYINNKDIK